MTKIHCFFEQSGTFKNEFKKLGFNAEDYDILNDFGETDHQMDLFHEIEMAYKEKPSIFNEITRDDLIVAFFPCVRFSLQCIMNFNGTARWSKNWSTEKLLENDIKLHTELHDLYCFISKLAIICIRKNIPLIIENPYSTQHYLSRYWAVKPKIIDMDRRSRGDFYEKPTQYFFINCEPKNNFIFEPVNVKPTKKILKEHNKVQRSIISSDYANRFIREFIL